VRDALAEAAEQRTLLEQLMSRQREQELQRLADQPTEVVQAATLAWAEGDRGWTLGQARQLVRDGYQAAAVVARTGWGERWFADLVGGDGYVRPEGTWAA
jgi:hypothetical protein